MDEEAWDDDEGFEEVKQGDEPVWEVPVTYDKNDPDRIFCPRCTHIWKTWEDKQRRVLMLKCDNCGHMEPAENTKPVYENYVVKQDQDILGAISPYTGQDPTLHQHTLVNGCKKCGYDEVVHFQADAGAKVESLKLAYVCKNCGHSWLMHGGEEEEFDGGGGGGGDDDDDEDLDEDDIVRK